MTGNLLQILGNEFSILEDGGTAQFSTTHILHASRGYFVASILTKELSQAIQDIAAFLAATEVMFASSNTGFLQTTLSGQLPLPDGRIFVLTGPFREPLRTAHSVLAESPLHAARTSRVGENFCSVLQQLHDASQLHGALTPGNLLLNESGDVWITEIGLRQALKNLGLNTTELPIALQSRYLAPEQLVGNEFDQRADIYSAGAVLYELLTGKPPFGGRTTAMVMASILAEETVPEKPDGVKEAEHIVEAILRAIEKDPDDRWTTAQQFGTALIGRTDATTSISGTRERAGCFPLVFGAISGGAYLLHRALI